MKRLSLFLLLFCSLSSLISAQEELPLLGDQLFLPAEYYVGDRVELRLGLAGAPGDYSIPSDLPESTWIDIHSLSLLPKGENSELVIEFTSYMPGTRTLPELSLSSGVLCGVKIHTSSILEDTSAPWVPTKGQLLLPGTMSGLIVLGLLIFLGPLLLLFTASKAGKWLSRLHAIHSARRPYRRVLRELKQLEERLGQNKAREFYFDLDRTVRDYLSHRLSGEFSSATSREYPVLCERYIDDREVSTILAGMAASSDAVKFGGRFVSLERRREDLLQARRLVQSLEQQHRSGE